MYCVYHLSYNGYVFYIGISAQPAIRYYQHACCADSCTAGYVHKLRVANQLPDFNIIYIGDHHDAISYETNLIKACAVISHKLCNFDLNPVNNRLIVPFDWNNRIKYPRKTYTKNIYKHWHAKKKEYEQFGYINMDNPAIIG